MWVDETGGEEEIKVRFWRLSETGAAASVRIFALVSFGREEWQGGKAAFVEGAVWRFDLDENWRNAGRSGLPL